MRRPSVRVPDRERSVNDLRHIYDHRDDYQIVDVREAYEWQAGRIRRSVRRFRSRLK